ncbi:hypothetical protein JRO89_XS01G0394900 [Xanthoceras sorbifolium]|uniref:NAC domain-containing protein n=1 Tax=Xanthoceras sorbifolium TaxID=99658 RepID=A0ABQ8IPA4_9ROSI|nr:hypothetical protein JRO89_XS01G0394900 [Xanthoceras sorbifolium]
MERFPFVRDNGVIRMPPGFRFQPTDEELVFHYLRCKIFSCPLPATIIPEINICKYDPWDLPDLRHFLLVAPRYLVFCYLDRLNSLGLGNMEQERYFFCNNEAKYRNGNRINRTTASGYWKATGVDRQIVSSSRNQMVGMKKTLVFYMGKPPHESRTDWIMHEYRLNYPNQMENWVICRIFLKKRSTREVADDNGVVGQQPVSDDYMMMRDNSRLGPEISSSSSSSSSSGISQVSSNEFDTEESSSRNFF